MRKEIYILIGLVAIFSLVLVSPAKAGALSSVTVTPSNTYGSYTANYAIGFTTATTILAASTTKIALTFPAGFNVGSAATSTEFISGMNTRTVTSLAVVGQVITLNLSATSTDTTGQAVALTLTTIVSPTAGGSFTMAVATQDLDVATIDSGTSDAFSITACCATPHPSDTAPPTSYITSPTEGLTITAGKKYVIEGAGADVGGSTIKRVEVSLDGGKSWSIAQLSAAGGNFSWQYVWENPLAGEYVIQVRATDSKGNRESPSAGKKVTVATPAVVPPAVSPEKPITEMTAQELEAKIAEIQQKIIDILGQIIQLFQQQIQALLAK